jgi:hypothetical protein
MAVISLPKAVEQFISATNAHDADALYAVFAPDAIVEDDGATFATEAELRGFIKNQVVAPMVSLTPISYDADRLVASGDGEFPGGPLTFAFSFTTKDDLITHLSIELATSLSIELA